MVTWEDKLHHSKCSSFPYFIHWGLEYLFGQLGSPVLALSPPSLPRTPSPLPSVALPKAEEALALCKSATEKKINFTPSWNQHNPTSQMSTYMTASRAQSQCFTEVSNKCFCLLPVYRLKICFPRAISLFKPKTWLWPPKNIICLTGCIVFTLYKAFIFWRNADFLHRVSLYISVFY